MTNFSQYVRSSSSSGSSSSSSSYSSSSSSASSNYSSQRSRVSLKAENLKDPCLLTISSSAIQLTGTMMVNGEVVKQLNGDRSQLDISPYLMVGNNTVEILGRYSPASSAIAIELSGSEAKVVQHTRGSGVLNYTLTITVR